MAYEDTRSSAERLVRPRTGMAEMARVAAELERLYPGSYIEQDVGQDGKVFFYLHCPHANAGGTCDTLDGALMVLGEVAIEKHEETR